MSNYFRNILDVIFPNCCDICNKRVPSYKHTICAECFGEVSYTNIQNPHDNFVFDKIKFLGNFNSVYSLFFVYHKSISSKLVHSIKYNNNLNIVKDLTNELSLNLLKIGFQKPDIIIPTPLHILKQRLRGFNQSELIANEIGKIINCKIVTNSIIRIKNTKSQTQLNKEERHKNVKSIFKTLNEKILIDKNILLVDDVITTGNTISELAKEIQKSNPKSISVVTLGVAI